MAKWIKKEGSGPAKAWPRETSDNASWAGNLASTAGARYNRLANNAPLTPASMRLRDAAQQVQSRDNDNENNNQYYGGGNANTPYIEKLNSLYDQIMNRKPFQYDLNGDLLYRQMADQYTQLGRQASADAMGQAAALTGGYGNSYATQVGNQANQQYLTMLNQNVPELWDRAYQAYLNEGDQLLQQYELAAAHPGYLRSMQPTGSGGGTKAADVDYNSILQAMVNGIRSVSNAATVQIPENELREWVYKLGLNDKGK